MIYKSCFELLKNMFSCYVLSVKITRKPTKNKQKKNKIFTFDYYYIISIYTII